MLSLLITSALTLARASQALKAPCIILADTNRDGLVNAEDETDKTIWTDERGALFLPNIGDTNRRCSEQYSNLTFTDYETLDDDELEACNDASGAVQRNSKYLAPLRTLPSKGLSANARGTVGVAARDPENAEKARIFVQQQGEWVFVTANHTFTADELENGLELGIDSRDVRRPEWDGRITVHFSITDGDESATDFVALRVAPLLSHHHLQEASRVFAPTDYMNLAHEQFLADLGNNTDEAGITQGVHEFTFWPDLWAQDMFEPAYASIPGPDGPVVLRVMIRSAQSTRISGRQLFAELRSEGVGAVQFLRDGYTIDGLGNLETIPPYTHEGDSFPAGRIVMGAWNEEEPLIIPFLRAQETQDPLILDTVWLYVGHVDEFLQFLPADNERGWVAMVDDPLAGMELLRQVSQDGHGGKRVFSRPEFDYDYHICIPRTSVDEILSDRDFQEANEKAARHIEGNIEILKNATGLTDEEIFRVPSTFIFSDKEAEAGCPGQNTTASAFNTKERRAPRMRDPVEAIAASGGHLQRRQEQTYDKQVVAYHPATINGVVLSNSFYLAARPWGPVVDGKDILAEAVREVYAKAAGYEVSFIDDWISHHIAKGEIHCGTNTWRDPDGRWW